MASSSVSGFFQSAPVIPPQYDPPSQRDKSINPQSDDQILERIVGLYLPSPLPDATDRHLRDFAKCAVDPVTTRLAVDAELNPPSFQPLTVFGAVNVTDPLRTSEGWKRLKDIGIKAGTVGLGYTEDAGSRPASRILQFATLHLWHGSAALVTCPAAMTDGAAVLLGRHLNEPDGDQPGRSRVFSEAYRRLISREPSFAWTSGQWMTERVGGSDVSGTETVAIRIDLDESEGEDTIGCPLGPWRIDGFKWFSSATDSDMAVLLAKTPGGISAFMAPLRRRARFASGESTTHNSTELNGVRIQRLKNKLGTKAVPTAELELKVMRAWLIGKEGQGIKEISSILNVTRLHTSSAAIGYMARGLAVSRAYSRVRMIRGGLLQDNSQHVKWLAGETIRYWAAVHLVFFTVALQGAMEQGWHAFRGTKAETLVPKSKSAQAVLLRILTPVMKAQITLTSVHVLRACMESLGGLGYCENNEDSGILNIARIFRDSVVGSIWEGTTSVMAEDVVRALRGRGSDGAIEVLDQWIGNVLKTSTQVSMPQGMAVRSSWAEIKAFLEQSHLTELHLNGRHILERIEAVVCACLMLFEARVAGTEVSKMAATHWISSRISFTVEAHPEAKHDHDIDKRIFLGSAVVPTSKL